MAEIARGGEERRPAIFVAAIARERRRVAPAPRRSRRGPASSSAKREGPQIVGAVLALAEPRADDRRRRPRDGRAPSASRHWRSRRRACAATPSSAASRRLERRPAADRVDEALVFRSCSSRRSRRPRLRPPSQRSRQQAAGQRAIGEQAHAVLEAERAHLARRAPVEQRERHLVGDDRECRASPAGADGRCRNW